MRLYVNVGLKVFGESIVLACICAGTEGSHGLLYHGKRAQYQSNELAAFNILPVYRTLQQQHKFTFDSSNLLHFRCNKFGTAKFPTLVVLRTGSRTHSLD